LIPQITPAELNSRLQDEDAPFLLDVREPEEFEYCHIPGSVLIPMSELEGRIGELPTDREIVAICHHGNRSLRVANFLQQAAGLDVSNLQGGVDAWARDVDPEMQTY
jgi:rhodanese-related sulfurtransferase